MSHNSPKLKCLNPNCICEYNMKSVLLSLQCSIPLLLKNTNTKIYMCVHIYTVTAYVFIHSLILCLFGGPSNYNLIPSNAVAYIRQLWEGLGGVQVT